MEYKVLEANGVENENIDGAAFNNFTTSGTSGIMPGILNECAITLPSSNVISIGTGELIISGFRVKISDPYTYSFVAEAATEINYHLIAQIVLSTDRTVTFEILCREATPLIRDDLFVAERGTYQLELATFTLYGITISNLEIKAPKIRISTTDSYSRAEIDAMFGTYIQELDALLGGG